MEKVYVDLDRNSYYIHIGEGLLNYIDDYTENADKIMIIVDENVDSFYGKVVIESFVKEAHKFIISPGERSKTFSNVEMILSKMLELNFTRNSKIIALGGGVVGDIAGFAASIYMRGISFLQVPTTLLSQVDSSVGGKTGVNLPNGKNIVGSFYQPEVVLIDTITLKTLPKREIISGLGEVIKYGIIWDYKFLNQIETDLDEILNLKEETLKDIISKCCKIKSEIVSKDEKEIGLRKILNYGHTIGHALETASDYKRYTHGEAVLIGMYYEALMAKGFDLIDDNYFLKIKRIITSLDIVFDISEYSKDILLDNMVRDKKNKEGKISFILPNGKGTVEEILLDRGEINW